MTLSNPAQHVASQSHRASALMIRRIYLPDQPQHLDADNHDRAGLAFSVAPLVITPTRWYRNINLLCIDYALRPRLSTRLTLGGRTFPRKPYPYGDMDFNHIYRYSYLDSHFQPVHHRLSLWLRPCWNAFLPLLLCRSRVKAHNFGTSLSPDHFRRRFTRWVSYYALFK